MKIGAKVENIEALLAFRVALIKFTEAANAALGDGESDVNSTVRWLENDQFSHWNTQIRHRKEELARATEALRNKQVFKDSTGRTQSAVEEQKAVKKAQDRLQEAEIKLANTKSWTKRLQKEMIQYKGAMQRFSTSATIDVPAAVNHLGALVHTLQEYMALNPSAAEASVDPAMADFFTSGGDGSMARAVPADDQQPKPEEKKEEPPPSAP